MGYDPDVTAEFEHALSVYEYKELVDSDTKDFSNYICLLHKQMSPNEYKKCIAEKEEKWSINAIPREYFLQWFVALNPLYLIKHI